MQNFGVFHCEDLAINIFFCGILGRHFGCRPLDPTLDIWSNFVKKEKKKRKHFTSLQFENHKCCVSGNVTRVSKGY